MTQQPAEDARPTVVDPQWVAERYKVPVTPDNLAMIRNQLLDAQSDVAAYLGRSITPTQYTVHGIYPMGPQWVFDPKDEPVRAIDSVTAEVDIVGNPTGYYTIVYTAGLDATDLNDDELAPIRRYVVAAAVNSDEFLTVWSSTPAGQARRIKSSTTEGQSVTYENVRLGGGGVAGSNLPGALPSISSLDKWRIAGREVFQRRGFDLPWPYGRGW